MSISHARRFQSLILALFAASGAYALDPHKGLTQYSRTVWIQGDQGLPQDTIRAIVQTSDGYLWVGTDEGLARFDGYEFTPFRKGKTDLPSNSINALAAATDGTLWVGTSSGLTSYRDGRFHTYTTKQGLPDDAITNLYTDHAGTLWIVAGQYLSRFQNGRFTNYAPQDLPLDSVRQVTEDSHHNLWVVGYGGVVEMANDRFRKISGVSAISDAVTTGIAVDNRDNLWVSTSKGLWLRAADGSVRKYTDADGLPDLRVRNILPDRDGSIWAGTESGLARLGGDRFVTAGNGVSRFQDPVYCLFEDREGDLWEGTPNGLLRFRDDIFSTYGKNEGLPSDEPNVVFQDHRGQIWVGFRDAGLFLFSGESPGQTRRQFTTREGLPDNEVFSIRETANGDLLIAARGGVVRMHGRTFTSFMPPDKFSRLNVYDALEDPSGDIWIAFPGGLMRMHQGQLTTVIPGGQVRWQAFSTLWLGRDGTLWAGQIGRGLWRIHGNEQKHFTTADGLSSDQIHTLYQDSDGTLWIGTFDGGLDSLRDGRFQSFTERDGLLSDNVGKISDDGESLWLSTTRGICRIPKSQLRDMASGKRKSLDPTNYGVGDGLRSAQCAPSNPTGGGGVRTSDGKLWFTTTRGLAVFDPKARLQPRRQPTLHLVEMTDNGDHVDLSQPVKLPPGNQSVQFRFTALHLSAPEQLQYSYRLEGVDRDWSLPGSRRVINYNITGHSHYRFLVRAMLPGGPASEETYAFEVLPHFYETAWFRILFVAMLLAGAFGLYALRLRQIRSRFALVLEERARLAREIHDTLAQGFVGISSQLDAVAMCLKDETSPARKFLDMARKMARHSLTEARRSVMDLRASALEGQDLAAALESGTRTWTAGSNVEVKVAVEGPERDLPQEMEQHLLRITQEAITNILKHAQASRIQVELRNEGHKLHLQISDNGRGFEPADVFSSLGGHFGLIGMRERAERMGGELQLDSEPGTGTKLEVTVPLP
ncbi:MAG TPA: two-component regulator propeller domain-containing protein [Verrucomicrobiae bacterium]|nr:two-component regulator propeller domain-containing protein [Verrucomicrobiae bacterium]